MARYLMAWELGANLGHLMHLLPIADCLRTRGHEVKFCVPAHPSAEVMLRERAYSYVVAPKFDATPMRHFVSYASVLQYAGFADFERLSRIVGEWRSLYETIKPDIVIADHAPHAVLAARISAVPVYLVGSGFSIPPSFTPFPPFRTWNPPKLRELEELDQSILDTVNRVLVIERAQPLTALCKLLDVKGRFIWSYAELDHYEGRLPGDAHYVGHIFQEQAAEPPGWPDGSYRVFAYLRPDVPHALPLLEELALAGFAVTAYAPGLDLQRLSPIARGKTRFATSPVDLRIAGRDADLAVTYGSAGATNALVLQGVPVLMFPQQVEQLMLSRRIAGHGAGAVMIERAVGRYAQVARRLVENAQIRQSAQALRDRFADRNSNASLSALVAAIDE